MERLRSRCVFRIGDQEDTSEDTSMQPEGDGEGPGLELGLSPAGGTQQWLQGHTVASRGQSAPDRPAGPRAVRRLSALHAGALPARLLPAAPGPRYPEKAAQAQAQAQPWSSRPKISHTE